MLRPFAASPSFRPFETFLHTAIFGQRSSSAVLPHTTACSSIRPSEVFPGGSFCSPPPAHAPPMTATDFSQPSCGGLVAHFSQSSLGHTWLLSGNIGFRGLLAHDCLLGSVRIHSPLIHGRIQRFRPLHGLPAQCARFGQCLLLSIPLHTTALSRTWLPFGCFSFLTVLPHMVALTLAEPSLSPSPLSQSLAHGYPLQRPLFIVFSQMVVIGNAVCPAACSFALVSFEDILLFAVFSLMVAFGSALSFTVSSHTVAFVPSSQSPPTVAFGSNLLARSCIAVPSSSQSSRTRFPRAAPPSLQSSRTRLLLALAAPSSLLLAHKRPPFAVFLHMRFLQPRFLHRLLAHGCFWLTSALSFAVF